MAKPDAPEVLRKGDEVVLVRDLREVPEGTEGKVSLVVGLSWIRYWVRFANGVAVGSVNRRDLATPAEWRWRQEHPDEDDAEAAGAEEAEEAGGDAGGGGGYTHAGVLVPQKLLDRSKAARERLGA
ncbi:hypothetical protein PO878_15145 [Iamia majanohamensis]|uniref:Uncharacterized protein n=1 Tax=Iamia majanohamensis TaxID=467976 RepID=A0AAE9Y7H2_9ACTN|nr:hypothetical protein [Iamia majanohamensis]WCO65838.1 hypothetical protein PO878_15145 [Iamia majanohamensis]